jgi:hypothetical protein
LGTRARLHRVEGGDHSFGVPKSSGRKAADVEAEILSAVETWLQDAGL